MRSIDIALKALVMLCVVGAGVASVAVGTAYDTYDCEYFSVEYPSSWDVKRSICTEYEGWEYSFDDVSNVNISDPSFHSAELTIGADQIVLYMMLSLDTLETGSFDEPTQHFIDTLNFKNSSAVVAGDTPNITYQLYNSTYFSVEYPLSWRVDKTQHMTLGTMYNFIDNELVAAVNFGSMDEYDLDFARVYLWVSRDSVGNGRFEEPVQHFIDTLHFKV